MELTPRAEWDPFAFGDDREAAAGLDDGSPQTQALREIQRIEFDALVEHLSRTD